MKKLIFLLLAAGLLFWWWWPDTVQGPSSDHAFEYIIRTTGESGSSALLPMVIALHGNGDTPDHFFKTMLKTFDYPARFILFRGPIDYPGISLWSRAWPRDAQGLRSYGNALADTVPVLLDRFPTEGRPLLLGFSGGAYVAYYLAAFHADLFSFILPLSGGLPAELLQENASQGMTDTRVIAFHGKADQVIGYYQGEAAVQGLRKRGIRAELVTFDGGHVDVFSSANPVVIERLRTAVGQVPF